jgi:Protein of unknown function (DUF2786)
VAETERLVMAGVLAAAGRRIEGGLTLPQVLVQLDAIDREDLVDDALVRIAGPFLGEVWDRGWSPRDLVHATSQKFDRGIGGLMADLVLGDARLQADNVPVEWAEQLAAVRAGRGRRSTTRDDFGKLIDRFDMVRFLVSLPRIAPVLTMPSMWGLRARVAGTSSVTPSDVVDPRMLERIRALLAKAESTTFDAEAEAFMSKAQELMARYAIDVAMVAAASTSASEGLAAGVRARRLHLDNPYAPQKAHLLGAVASANNARVVWHDDFGFATVMGFPVELDLIELTFTSLLVQMTRSMAAASGGTHSRGRSPAFRRAFVLSYATRIGERLREAQSRARESAEEHYGGALVPVQAAREAAIRERADEWFPDTTPMRSRSVDAGGWYAGRAAADLARLEPGLGEIR